MEGELYQKMLRAGGLTEIEVEKAVKTEVECLEAYLAERGVGLHEVTEQFLDDYMRRLIAEKKNTLLVLLALSKYYYEAELHDIYIYFTRIHVGLGVMDSIRKRLDRFGGKEVAAKILEGLPEPPLGPPISDIPTYTSAFMNRIMKYLDRDGYEKVLCGNNHQIPRESAMAEREAYQRATSLDAYLKELHDRMIAEIMECMKDGKVWYEQEITPAVVEYVKENQEIGSAVRDGNKLYTSKIPYDTVKFLAAESDVEKRYHACHCPFVRKALLDKNPIVPYQWCNCSSGFQKFPYEIIFDRELNITLLESSLKGDFRCRFVIDLGDMELK